jgi:hypothetical protein
VKYGHRGGKLDNEKIRRQCRGAERREEKRREEKRDSRREI